MAKLFKNNIIKEKLENFEINDFDEKIKILENWYKLYKNGVLEKKTESEIEQSFNEDILGKVLGYSSITENDIYNREPQPKTPEGGQKADFGLGYFYNEDHSKNIINAVIEVKDTKTPLDKPQRREGNLTPIQQGFKYKPFFPKCDFIIVSNFYETRLFIDSYYDYEAWTLDDLLDSKDNYYNFRKFYYLLCKQNLITKKGDSNTKSLLSLIRTQEKEITKEFYKDYSALRLELLRDLRDNNSVDGKISKEKLSLIFEKAQKIIDRIVFIHFCEDINNLLPNGKLKETIDYADNLVGVPIWEILKGFFEAVNSGSSKLGIPDGYNGGLFHEDKELNSLKVGDEICKKFVDLGEYDFADDLSVNILGHIFEQSISDIEEIKEKINKNEDIKSISKRKKDGIFYTPEYIVDYIVKNSVGKKIEEWEDELKEQHKLKEDINDKNYTKRAIQVYTELQEKVQNIKVLDPACGSGAFLVKVFDFLLDKNKEISKKLDDLGMNQGLFSSESHFKTILQNNIYGVDLNEESVEITKLSLWLKTASKGKKLANLDKNIKCGNSLIDDKEIAGDKAFVWETEFKEIFDNGGFDVVIGNPPYIKEFVNKNAFEGLKDNKYYQGKMDLWQFFACKGLDWLKDDGYISYIAPNNWVNNAGASIMRNKVLEDGKILQYIDFGDYKIFEDAGIQTMIFIIQKTNNNINYISNYTHLGKGSLEDIEMYLAGGIIFNNIKNINAEIDKKYLHDKNISFINKKIGLITDKIEKQGNFKLKDKEIAQGIVGAPDNAYLLSNINNFTNKEKEFLKVFYTNVGKNTSGISENFIIYLTDNNFEGEKLEDYINIFNHFKPLKEKLVEARIKLMTPNKPYYFLHRERDEKFFKKGEKIIGGTRVNKTSFYYTEDEFYGSRALNFIKTDRINLKFLTLIFNSSISNFWLRNKGKVLGNLLQVDKGPLLTIPIKNISISEQKPFIEKADFMLDKNKELQEKLNSTLEFLKQKFEIEKISKKLEKFYELDFGDFKKQLKIKNLGLDKEEDLMSWFNKKKEEFIGLKSEIDNCDREIDDMVFDLYGLSEVERNVVLGSN